MDAMEPKRLALLRILQVLETYSDYDHPLTQEEIAVHLEQDYGISIERKAVGRNLSLLKEAGIEIGACHSGNYLERRLFEDAELRMLIDGILSSKYITAKHSKDLIDRLCGLSNRHFRAHVKHIYSINDWNKTENQALFYNVEIVDAAIEDGKQISFDYNRYDIDRKLHKTATHIVSPYQMILHHQQYYLMARNERWEDIAYYRLDHITGMTILEKPLTPIRDLPGYLYGIDYKAISSSLPYMYNDEPQKIEFLAQRSILDQIMDWFGTSVQMQEAGENKIRVTVKTSPMAMEHWAMQYCKYVEVIAPETLRERIRETIRTVMSIYGEN